MRLPIDTQIPLWSLMDPGKSGKTGKQLVTAPEHTVFVSAVSLLEIRIKESIGKLELPRNFEAQLEKLQFEELPMSIAHTAALAGLRRLHKDPFDRMPLAQSRVEGLRPLTADATLAKYGDWILAV